MSDKWLFGIVSVLILVGILFSYSLPVYFTHTHGMSEFHFVRNMLLAGLMGIGMMFYLSRLKPEIWLKRIGFAVFGVFLFLMFIMNFLPESIVPTINGAKRWIRLPGLNLSPVEFFKVGFIFFLSWSLTRKFYLPEKQRTFGEELLTFAPYIILLFLLAFLIAIMQNDFGQIVVLGVTMILMSVFAGSSIRLFVTLMVTALLGGIALILASTHRVIRIKQWWVSAQDMILSIFPNFIASSLRIEGEAVNHAYQVSQSLKAIYHGGFTGTGLGSGVVKLGYLSDVHTDFVLAGIAEETGVVGILMLSLLMLLMIYRIFKIASRSDNHVFYLFAMGIATMISSQFLINALGIIGLIPLKGIAVPFISYGGSSVLALSFAIGLVLMISKRAKL